MVATFCVHARVGLLLRKDSECIQVQVSGYCYIKCQEKGFFFYAHTLKAHQVAFIIIHFSSNMI